VTDPNEKAIDPAIQQAVKAGIPVVIFNAGEDVYQKLGAIGFVGQSEELAGQQAGQKMVEGGVTHLLCVIQQPLNVLYTRCNAAKASMEKAGGQSTQLVVDGNDPTSSQRQIAAALSQDSSIDGILTLGEIGFQPAMAAIKQQNAQGKVKIGTFDMSDDDLAGVKDGSVLFVVDQQQYLQGYEPVAMIAQYARYRLAPLNPYVTGPSFVTKDNVESVEALIKQGIR
jgi:simple sugar transport system substrate-binding protein